LGRTPPQPKRNSCDVKYASQLADVVFENDSIGAELFATPAAVVYICLGFVALEVWTSKLV